MRNQSRLPRNAVSRAAPPEHASLAQLRHAAAGCKACPLWRRGTQTVFGEGPRKAKLMLVGEQPGNDEDLQGHPFVGPAGKLLNRAIEEAGIDRTQVYVTNVMKHFKWEPRGKRRLHKRPTAREIAACRPWLEAELSAVRPKALICLGASAAQALFGRKFRVSRQRGQIIPCTLAPYATATVHPSSILRIPDDAERRVEHKRFVADLKRVAKVL